MSTTSVLKPSTKKVHRVDIIFSQLRFGIVSKGDSAMGFKVWNKFGFSLFIELNF